MDPQTSDKTPGKGRLMDISKEPAMDRLAEILGNMESERREVFYEWLEQADGDDPDEKN